VNVVVVVAVGNNMGKFFCCCWVLVVDTTVMMSVVFHDQTVPLHWPSKLASSFCLIPQPDVAILLLYIKKKLN